MEIMEILGYDPETRQFRTNTLYEFRELPESSKERVLGSLVRTENPMQNIQKLENAGIYRKI
jgi:pilus assembly protein CpaF